MKARNWCGAILNDVPSSGRLRPDAPAFVDAEGAPLKADGFAAYVSGLRRVGVNAEFNGALCRGLLAVRFDLETPFVPKSKDFFEIAGPAGALTPAPVSGMTARLDDFQ